MGDGIIFIDRVIFQKEKKVGGVKHSSIKQVDSMSGEEGGIDVVTSERRGGSWQGGEGNGQEEEQHGLL